LDESLSARVDSLDSQRPITSLFRISLCPIAFELQIIRIGSSAAVEAASGFCSVMGLAPGSGRNVRVFDLLL